MKQQLIDYLNSNNLNALAAFLRSWLKHKVPNRPEHEIDMFIRVFIEHLVHVPAMFDSRYQNAISHLLEVAKAELGLNSVMNTKTNTIIKYY